MTTTNTTAAIKAIHTTLDKLVQAAKLIGDATRLLEGVSPDSQVLLSKAMGNVGTLEGGLRSKLRTILAQVNATVPAPAPVAIAKAIEPTVTAKLAIGTDADLKKLNRHGLEEMCKANGIALRLNNTPSGLRKDLAKARDGKVTPPAPKATPAPVPQAAPVQAAAQVTKPTKVVVDLKATLDDASEATCNGIFAQLSIEQRRLMLSMLTAKELTVAIKGYAKTCR